MRARAVIGANFGDEGKGLITDFLCAMEGADVVVRFNGGSQAGHTVVTPDGSRHVFRHFGSGTLVGIPTFLSQFFICNPLQFFRELDKLRNLNITPKIYAHPDCVVTTFADMIINQRLENKRGANRHGSVGVGINETVERSSIPELKITMSDLWNKIGSLESRLGEICEKYASFRTGNIINEPAMIQAFIKGCWKFAEHVSPLGIGQCKDPIFEGAQGLLLDQNNKEFFPHLTRSNTGIKNVRVLCDQAGIKDIDVYYVSRTYMTKHGAGILPAEDPKMNFSDETNVDHPWQGRLRFAPLDLGDLYKRCEADYGSTTYKIAMTHFDQCIPKGSMGHTNLRSYGPSRSDVYKNNADQDKMAAITKT